MDQGRVSEVVQSVVSEDGGSGLEPDGGITEVSDAVVGQQLRGDASERSEHGPASVDDLELTVLGEGLRVGGEAGRVPAVVSLGGERGE